MGVLFMCCFKHVAASTAHLLAPLMHGISDRGREGSVAPCVTRFPANQWLSCLIFAIRTLGRPSNPGRADVMLRWVMGEERCPWVCVIARVYKGVCLWARDWLKCVHFMSFMFFSRNHSCKDILVFTTPQDSSNIKTLFRLGVRISFCKELGMQSC